MKHKNTFGKARHYDGLIKGKVTYKIKFEATWCWSNCKHLDGSYRVALLIPLVLSQLRAWWKEFTMYSFHHELRGKPITSLLMRIESRIFIRELPKDSQKLLIPELHTSNRLVFPWTWSSRVICFLVFPKRGILYINCLFDCILLQQKNLLSARPNLFKFGWMHHDRLEQPMPL